MWKSIYYQFRFSIFKLRRIKNEMMLAALTVLLSAFAKFYSLNSLSLSTTSTASPFLSVRETAR
jgi:hypothetical protein